MKARFFTDIGPIRQRNEDDGGIFYNHTEQKLLIICDGMGGHNSGDVASKFVTEKLSKRFMDENYIELDQAESWLRTNISDINRQLYDIAHLGDENHGMGTTIVCAIMYEHEVVIANIGDSRAYFIEERDMRQLTNDHTFVNHLVMAGELTKEEAKVHPQRNMITKVVGSDRRIFPDIFKYDYGRYDYIVLSSDGLTDYVDEAIVHQEFYKHDNTESIGQALLNLAIDANARDNISLIIVPIKGGN